MTKQRLAFTFACVMVAGSSFAQTAPVKKGGAMAGGPGLMPGAEQWMDLPAASMIGTPSVDVGGTLKPGGPAGRPGDRWALGRGSAFINRWLEGRAALPPGH